MLFAATLPDRPDEPQRPQELWEQVFERLRSQIVVGDRRAGERLVEADIASSLGVSRGPVRAALAELARRGLVEGPRRRGAHVALLTPEDVDELYTVRASLEVLAVGLATTEAMMATAQALAAHVRALERVLEAEDRHGAAAADLAFHRELVTMGANSRLLQTWELLADQVQLAIASVQHTDPSVASPSGQHLEIVEALEAGERQRARMTLAEHLEDSRKVMRCRAAAAPTGGA